MPGDARNRQPGSPGRGRDALAHGSTPEMVAREQQRLERRQSANALDQLQSMAFLLGGCDVNSTVYAAIYQDVNEGYTAALSMAARVHEALDITREKLGIADGDVEAWLAEEHTSTSNGSDGTLCQFTYTTAQAMDALALAKAPDALLRMQLFGFRVAQFPRFHRRHRCNHPHRPISVSLLIAGIGGLQSMVNTLSPTQASYVQRAFDLVNGMAKEANKTALRMKGRELFIVGEYWRQRIDRSDEPLAEAKEETSRRTAVTPGEHPAFNDRLDHRKPVLIGDFSDDLDEQVELLSNYTHLDLPARNVRVLLAKLANSTPGGGVLRERFGIEFEQSLLECVAAVAGLRANFVPKPRLESMTRSSDSAPVEIGNFFERLEDRIDELSYRTHMERPMQNAKSLMAHMTNLKAAEKAVAPPGDLTGHSGAPAKTTLVGRVWGWISRKK